MSDNGTSDVTNEGNSPTLTADTPILPTAPPPPAPPPPAAPSALTDPNTVLLALMAALLKQELALVLDQITIVETHTKTPGWTGVQYEMQPGNYLQDDYGDWDFEEHNVWVAP